MLLIQLQFYNDNIKLCKTKDIISWMFTVQREIIVKNYFITTFPVLKNKSCVLYIAP